eukprot:5867016-Prymnesium_polylepis.1
MVSASTSSDGGAGGAASFFANGLKKLRGASAGSRSRNISAPSSVLTSVPVMLRSRPSCCRSIKSLARALAMPN